MSKEKLINVLGFYYENIGLKEIERQGWIEWNVKGRRESIPDHVWATQILAFSIWSEFDIDVDIDKVMKMLQFHETEEIEIGDNTPFGKLTPEEKLRLGHKAVNKICSRLKKGQIIIDLIKEFDARETPEAKFAYYCDKMECDLMAKFYSDSERTSLDNIPRKVAEDELIKEIMKENPETVADLWLKFDAIIRYQDSEIFTEMINFLKEYQIKKS